MASWRSLYGEQPIAIVGMSGTYPGGRDLDAFWDLLRAGRCGVEAVADDDLAAARIPPSLYRDPRYVRACAPIADHDCLDAGFFGISPAEARMTDPQHRQFLQHCYLALEQAGYATARGDLSIGVFGGIGIPSYMIELAMRGVQRVAATAIVPFVVGTDKDYVATMAAYRLDLHGPAMTVQTACSTSLVAVHVAVQSLLAQECDLALAGGASVRFPHRAGYMFQEGGIMSRDGYCRSFETSASGTIFGSGAGVVALRRLDDAIADGDPIRAVILGTAVNNDGARKVGYVAPSVDGQVAVISEALAVSGLDPDQVDYVEAHGTATPIGDAIEATGLSRVFSSQQRRGAPCFVGSVKSNIGHVEAAAGVAALTKTVMALERNWLPPSLFVERPIGEISGQSIEVARDGRPWPQRGVLRVAGVSSFGVGGTNAHVVVASAPPRPAASKAMRWHVARFAAKSRVSLAATTERFAGWLDRNPDADPASIAQSLEHGRPHFPFRTALPFRSIAELTAGIRTSRPETAAEPAPTRDVAGVAWVFGGQGSSLRGVAADLYAEAKEFAAGLDEVDALLEPELGLSLRDIVVGGTREPTEPRLVQPITIAVHIALIRLWQTMGVKPAFVLGHSIGEISAAVAAGLVTWDSALRFAAARGEAMDNLCDEGAMLAVRAGEASVSQVLTAANVKGVSVAAVNSPSSIVLAGAPGAIAHAKVALDAAHVATIKLPVARAYHSAMIEPALDVVGEASRLLRAGSASNATLISTLTGSAVSGDRILDPDFWKSHARETVAFEAALRHATGAGATRFLEVDAEPKLGVHVKTVAPDASLWSTQTNRAKGLGAVLAAASGLYTVGVDVDLAASSRNSSRQPISGYAFEPARYSIEGVDKAEQQSASSQVWTFTIGPKSQPYLSDHRIAGRVVIPGTLYIELTLAVAREVLGASVALTDITFHRPLFVADNENAELRLTVVPIDAASAAFTIDSVIEGQTLRTSSGQIVIAEGDEPQFESPSGQSDVSIAVDAFYAKLSTVGLDYGPTFRSITALHRRPHGVSAKISIPAAVANDIADYVLHPAVLDACLHASAAAIKTPAADRTGYLPVAIRRLRALRAFDKAYPLEVVAEQRYTTDDGRIALNIRVSDDRGPVVLIDELMLGPTGSAGTRQSAGTELFHRLRWAEATIAPDQPRPVWLVADAQDPQAGILAQTLRDRGIDVTRAAHGGAPSSFNGQGLTHRIVYFAPAPDDAPLNASDALWRVCGPLLDVARVLPRGGASPGFAIVTRGGAPAFGELRDPLQAGLWGCGTSIISERPDVPVRLIDIGRDDDDASIAALADILQSAAAENRLAIRGGEVFAPRLESFEPEARMQYRSEQFLRLETERPGDLDELSFKPLPMPMPGPSEVLVRVEAAALNFLDVLAALGQRPDLPQGPCIFLGSECAGVVEAVGSDVKHLAVGDKVVGIAMASLATHVLASGAAMHRYAGLTASEACALPICYGTAEYALNDVARLSAGESVLIHAATGGVGLAAIEVARRLGARILATAGSDAKREELRRRGIADVFDSRSSSFIGGARLATKGRGVDVALNTLTGSLLQGCIETLAPFGRVVDISKRDIYAGAALDLAPFRRNLSYNAVDLIGLHMERPERLRALIAGVLDRVSAGVYQRLPITVFPTTSVPDAFRFMAGARHVGKIVIDFSQAPEPRTRTFAVFRADAAYVITGGLGALGLQVAARLAQGGARQLILVGRHEPSPEAAPVLSALRSSGCDVATLTLDVADANALRVALAGIQRMRPIRGVIHAAGVLDDASIEDTDGDRFRRVSRPKLGGMEALCAVVDIEQLDFLIAFSSTSTIFAPPGQTAYAAVNAAMEAMAEAAGGKSISWGAWAGGGMASRSGASEIGRQFGLPPLLATDGADAFSRFIASDTKYCAIFARNPGDLAQGARQFGAAPLLQNLVSEPTEGKRPALLADFEALDMPQERVDAVAAFLLTEVERTLGAAAGSVRVEEDFRNLGIDSLMALELAKRVEYRLGLPLNPALLALHPSIAKLAPVIATMAGLVQPPDGQAQQDGVAIT